MCIQLLLVLESSGKMGDDSDIPGIPEKLDLCSACCCLLHVRGSGGVLWLFCTTSGHLLHFSPATVFYYQEACNEPQAFIVGIWCDPY